MSAPNYNLIIIMAFSGLGMIATGIKRMRQIRLIQDTGSIRIASAALGFVELQGFAWQIDRTQAPLSGRDCIFYELVVEESLNRSMKSSSWEPIYDTTSTRPFILADESGHVLIHPDHAKIDIGSESSFTMNWSDLNSIQKKRILDEADYHGRGFWDRGLFSPRALRVTERVILLGSPLYALGTLRGADSRATLRPRLGLQFFFEQVRKLRKFAPSALDRNGDGIISHAEWQQGFFETAIRATGTGGPMIIPAGMKITSRNYGLMMNSLTYPLFLADCHQEELLRRLSRRNLVMVVGGCALLAGACAITFI